MFSETHALYGMFPHFTLSVNNCICQSVSKLSEMWQTTHKQDDSINASHRWQIDHDLSTRSTKGRENKGEGKG